MGCFSSDQPTYTPPPPPTLATAPELYGQAQSFYQDNGYGGLLGAQQTALNNANNPNYYSTFQPTSFEQALGNQQFQNIWPDEQALIMNQLSKSGMAYSPVAAQTLGNAYGNLSTGIGEYLNNQGNTRATNAINAGLGISPGQLLTPFVQTGQTQSNDQAQLNYGYQQAQAQQQYQQQMNQYQQDQSMAQMLGAVSPIAGNIYNATQGNLSSGLSGTFNTLGQVAPLAMSAAGMPGGFGIGSMFSGMGQGGQGGNGVNMASNSMSQGYGQNMGGINNVQSVDQLPNNPFG